MSDKQTMNFVMQHWFGVDKVLFGGPANETLSGVKLEQYATTKGALLQNLYELYTHVGFQANQGASSVNQLIENASTFAETATSRAKELLKSTPVAKILREEAQAMGAEEGVSPKQVAKYVVEKRMKTTALDSMLIESVSQESNLGRLANNWKGRVLRDAHKQLRDSLVDLSF